MRERRLPRRAGVLKGAVQQLDLVAADQHGRFRDRIENDFNTFGILFHGVISRSATSNCADCFAGTFQEERFKVRLVGTIKNCGSTGDHTR